MDKKSNRVRNWSHYNKSLVQRGSINIWFDVESFKNSNKKPIVTGKGRPQKFSDEVIHCALIVKYVFKLTFRAVEGFIKGLAKLMKMEINVPSYSLLCKRQKKLNINFSNSSKSEKLNLLVDSTGLKVFGEGEWKVKQHGVEKKRVWKKLHLSIDSKTKMIESFVLTDSGTQDCQAFPGLIDNIKDKDISSCTGDGAYDRFSVYEKAQERDFNLIAPPQHNAKTSEERTRNKHKASKKAVEARDKTIEKVREFGTKNWKVNSGYHKRSLVENCMYRFKNLVGGRLVSRKSCNQSNEVSIKCEILNKMLSFGLELQSN